MNIKGLVITFLLMDLIGCSTNSSSQPENNPPAVNAPSLAGSNPAPEIEETTVISPEQQRNTNEGSAVTKDVPIARPPLISPETIDCIIELAINKECAGFNIDDDD